MAYTFSYSFWLLLLLLIHLFDMSVAADGRWIWTKVNSNWVEKESNVVIFVLKES